MGLFQSGRFTLASGQESIFKIECDALDDDDWHTLATIIAAQLGYRYGEVVGVPRGGLKLASALDRLEHFDAPGRLVVDDVYTTGGSLRKVMQAGDRGFVVFARSAPPSNIGALFRMV
jgi:orotate phosphoribosyltransferase